MASTRFFGSPRRESLQHGFGRPGILNLRVNSRRNSAGLVRGAERVWPSRSCAPNCSTTSRRRSARRATTRSIMPTAARAAPSPSASTSGLDSVEVSVRDWGGGFQQLAPRRRAAPGRPAADQRARRPRRVPDRTGQRNRGAHGFRHPPRSAPGRPARTSGGERGPRGVDAVAARPGRRCGGDGCRTTCSPAYSSQYQRADPRSRFSLERFSDVFLVMRELSAHVQCRGVERRVSFALGAAAQQLELTIGPLRTGAIDELHGRWATPTRR